MHFSSVVAILLASHPTFISIMLVRSSLKNKLQQRDYDERFHLIWWHSECSGVEHLLMTVCLQSSNFTGCGQFWAGLQTKQLQFHSLLIKQSIPLALTDEAFCMVSPGLYIGIPTVRTNKTSDLTCRAAGGKEETGVERPTRIDLHPVQHQPPSDLSL